MTGRQGRRDARLEHPVTLDHAAAGSIDQRTIESMGHLADQPLGGPTWQTSVGVKGDYVAHSGRYGLRRSAIREKGSVGRTAQPTVKFVQLAALAFPSHPFSLRRIPDSSTMEQEKSPRAVRRRTVALVQACDRRPRRAE